MALRDAGGRRRAHHAWCPSARSGTPCPARTSAAAGRGTSGSPACRRRCGRGSSCRAPRTALSAEASLHPAHALVPVRLQAQPATAPAMAVMVHSHAMRRLTSAALGLPQILRLHWATLSLCSLLPVAPPEERGARRPERGRPRRGRARTWAAAGTAPPRCPSGRTCSRGRSRSGRWSSTGPPWRRAACARARTGFE